MNDYLNQNLNTLVDKLNNEGIEKAKDQALQIITEAQRQASVLIEEAKKHISSMETQSLAEMTHKRDNVNSELKSAAQQTIHSIKNELISVISNKIAFQGIKEALSNKEFLQKIIFTVVQKWNPVENNLRFELLVNKEDELQLKDFVDQRIKKELSIELEIVVENKIKSGFKIGIKSENYYVSFSDEEFENFFKSYLRERTIEWVYSTKKSVNE